MNKNVYLCGPISGLSYSEAAEGWREQIRKLVDPGIKLISPMRGKEYFKDVASFDQQVHKTNSAAPQQLLSGPKAILGRDSFDVANCDILLMNVLGAKDKSLGSICEVAWAWQMKKPIILVIEEDFKNPHTHDFLLEMSNFVVHNLQDAAKVVNAVFSNY